MKAALLSLLALCAVAQADPKPPIGVPADARAFNGKWYKVVLEKLTWPAAKQKAEQSGGRLAVIPDEATWGFVKSLSKAPLWLGATDEKTEAEWVWVDGSKMEFTSWYKGQPDNAGGNEHYLATHEGAWNDVPKSGVFGQYKVAGFVCEWVSK